MRLRGRQKKMMMMVIISGAPSLEQVAVEAVTQHSPGGSSEKEGTGNVTGSAPPAPAQLPWIRMETIYLLARVPLH
jgi:hypothetical protein